MNFNSIITFLAESMELANSIDELCWILSKNCISELNFESCIIYLVDEKENALVQRSAFGLKNTSDPLLNIPVGEKIVGFVAKHGVSELIYDTAKDNRYPAGERKFNSELLVPIKNGFKVIGVIDCEHSLKGFFTIQHLHVLTVISSFLANKIEELTLQLSPSEKSFSISDTLKKISEQEQNYLILTTQTKTYKIHKNEIIRAEAASNYCTLYTIGELKIVFAKTLKALEKEIDSPSFIRTHKSHLVNLKYIEECRNNELILSDKTAIAISIRKSPLVKKALLNI